MLAELLTVTVNAAVVCGLVTGWSRLLDRLDTLAYIVKHTTLYKAIPFETALFAD